MRSFDEIHWILIVDMSNFLHIWIKESRASQGKVRCLWPIYLMTASAGVSTTNAVIRDPDFIFVYSHSKRHLSKWVNFFTLPMIRKTFRKSPFATFKLFHHPTITVLVPRKWIHPSPNSWWRTCVGVTCWVTAPSTHPHTLPARACIRDRWRGRDNNNNEKERKMWEKRERGEKKERERIKMI